ncbi:MAG: hypothetical protein RLY31_801 [Bacteroidota bacterium]|jgi:tRNA threonylcarbamoyladenosine biosynthesis protein TsaE
MMRIPEQHRFDIVSAGQLPAAAGYLLDMARDARIFALRGDLGAGKTSLVKELCTLLGVTEPVTSPTFSLVNEYLGHLPTVGTFPVFHMDLYRLASVREAHAIGLDQYLYGDGFCFIEWPDIIAEWLPEGTLHVRLDIVREHSRIMTVKRLGPTGKGVDGQPGQ